MSQSNRAGRYALPAFVAMLAAMAMATMLVQSPAASATPHGRGSEPALTSPAVDPGKATPAHHARIGTASVYARRFKGRRTASGEIYDGDALTAAHKTLPFGTLVKVTNLKNSKVVTVRINDRGPAAKGRLIDVSPRAAEMLDMRPQRLAKVRIEVIEGAPRRAS